MSIAPANPESIQQCAQILRRGGLVAFPTETVYGLGADARNQAAVSRVFSVKRRPVNHPLIVHLANSSMMDDWALDIPATARVLTHAFWPGPLTIILRRSDRVIDAVTGGHDTVGLRVPSHPVALALLDEFGSGIAAPSANRFTQVSPTTAAHVFTDLGDEVDLILDGGPCRVGVESTIVDLSQEYPRLLRPGGISREALELVLDQPLSMSITNQELTPSPGQHPIHYSPKTRVIVVDRNNIERAAQEYSRTEKRMHVFSFQPQPNLLPEANWWQMPMDLAEVARQLYQRLREADATNCELILVELPPANGLGEAISDRLLRAAGPTKDTRSIL
jgi:L-threonylcarbamoyladenylate synthase